MKKKILFLLILFIPFMVSAEEFKREIITGEYQNDRVTQMDATHDGNLLLLDYRYTGVYFLVKLDKTGNILWEKRYEGEYNPTYNSFLILNNDEFIVAGSYAIDKEEEYYGPYGLITKYDKDGNILWEKKYENVGSFKDIALTSDNEYVVHGSNMNDEDNAFIAKIDESGNVIWEKIHDENNEFTSLLVTKNNEVIVAGSLYISDTGTRDAVIIKYDKDGNLLWERKFGGSKSDVFRSIALTNEESILGVGYSNSTDIDGLSNKGNDAIIVKYDKDGNILWKKNYGDSGSDSFNSLFILKDGSFVTVGYSTSKKIGDLDLNLKCSIWNGCDDALIVKFNKDGELQWQDGHGGDGYDSYSDVTLIDDDIIAVGAFSSETTLSIYTLKYELDNIPIENGTSTVEQQGRYGIVKPTPNEGYEVDKIIVKDKSGNVLDVEVTKQEDGTYSFELYTDVSVEVLFKEKLVNPKTGVSSFIGVMFTLMLIGISGFFLIKNCNNSYEL